MTSIPSTSTSTITPVRQSPWSRLGSAITIANGQSDRDILATAGLDWSVRLAGMYTDSFNPVPDHRASVRSDTGRVLGVVGVDYCPLQNDQMLGLLRCLAGQVPLQIETAGSFRHGALTWIQARMPGLEIRLGQDVTNSYLLASNGHDGNRPFVLGLQSIRVVCQNTLALASAQVRGNQRRTDLARGHVIRHTKGMPIAIQDALSTYRETMLAKDATQAAYHHLARVPLAAAMERTLFDRVFATDGPDESDRALALKKAREERLQAILASPTSRVSGTAGTAFSLFQAVVEYVDYFRPTRTSEGTDPDAQRLHAATFGSGAELKQRAWSAILDLTAA